MRTPGARLARPMVAVMAAGTTAALSVMLAMVTTLASPGAVHAQASIGDCEKITAADAYNQCLAKFGPESKVKNLAPEKPSDFKAGPEDAAATAQKGPGRARHAGAGAGGRRRGHAARRASGGGRKRMTIHVGRRRRH